MKPVRGVSTCPNCEHRNRCHEAYQFFDDVSFQFYADKLLEQVKKLNACQSFIRVDEGESWINMIRRVFGC